MKPLTYKRKKENAIFLLQLIQYFFKTGPKPKFLKSILKDQSFFSLIKNTFLFDFAYSSLKDFSEFKNTWLKNEIEKYLPLYEKQEIQNLKFIDLLKEITCETKIPFLILKEYNYKLHPKYQKDFRFSTDIDMLVYKKDLFKIDKKLLEKGVRKRHVGFDLDFKPMLYKDGHIIIYSLPTYGSINMRKKGISHVIRSEYQNLSYLLKGHSNQGGLLELHFSPNKYLYPKNHLPFSEIWKHSYTNEHGLQSIEPFLRILYDADHFFRHLKYRRVSENGLDTFIGNLKRLCDLGFNLLYEKDSIDWKKFIEIAAKYNLSENAYGYLWLGKKWLNLEIPQNVLDSLKKQANKIQIKFIHSLNALLIFQDKKIPLLNLYARLFLYHSLKQGLNPFYHEDR